VGDLLYRTSEWELCSTEPLSGRLTLPILIHFGVGDLLYRSSFILEWEIDSTEPHSFWSGRFPLPILIHLGVGDLLYRSSFILEWEIDSTEPLSGRFALPNL
jgi:hypothetical protein